MSLYRFADRDVLLPHLPRAILHVQIQVVGGEIEESSVCVAAESP